MEQIKIQTGLIGFFDILGYQSFLENNDPEVATSEVLSIISGVGDSISKHFLSFEEMSSEDIKRMVNSIQWLVFSDTILMAMEGAATDLDESFLFLGVAGMLCRHMFDFGLPLRGAIKRGTYQIAKSCFAGRAIVEAYQIETSLELAACVLDESELSRMHETAADDKEAKELIDAIIVKYMTPVKGNLYKKLPLLNFLPLEGPKAKPLTPDIHQMVLESFWGHNKDITLSAQIKANNTENFLRFLRHKFPHQMTSQSAGTMKAE